MHEAAVAAQAATDLRRKVINTVITVLNFPLGVAMLLGLDLIGWVVIKASGDIWQKVALAAVIVVIYLTFRRLAGYAYGLFTLATCCTGLIFLPIFSAVVGYATLLGVQMILPQFFTLAVGSPLLGIVAGLVFGGAQIPELGSFSRPEIKTEKKEEPPVRIYRSQ